jgi:type VI secretion system protein ImpI
MLVRLKVLKDTPPCWEHVFEMEKDILLIGRDPKNELPLEGTSSGVSRQHAKLVRHGNSYSIIDLASRNGTILNDIKIEPNVEYVIKNGDLIHICEFVIEFSAEQSEVKPEQDFFPKRELSTPFAEESQNLIAALDRMCQKFEQEESSVKDEALQKALRDSLERATLNKAAEILSQVLQSRTGPVISFPAPAQKDLELDISSSYDRVERAIAVLLDFFVKMIQALDEFEIFFLDRTITSIIIPPKSKSSKPGKSFSFHKCTAKELKGYLFDPEISLQEAQKRIDWVQANAEKLMMHQISLLAGYKASVSEGAQQLLQKMSPQKFREKLKEKTLTLGPFHLRYSLIPLLATLQIAKEFSRLHQELTQEDPAKIEGDYFHKPYRLGYQKSMNKIPGRNPSSD